MNAKTILPKLVALLEVTIVYFGFIWLPGAIFKLELWMFDLLVIFVALLAILLPRRNLSDYGLTLAHWKQDLSIALTAYLPASLAILPTAFLDSTSWSGALILSASILAAFLFIAWLTRKKSIPVMGIITIVVTVIMFGMISFSRGSLPSASTGVGSFIIYAILVGFGEELLWRGYIQSRLNQAFGKPFQFMGVMWGPGLILAAAFFGFVHVLNGYPGQWYWAWGLWTVFNGLLLGFVREKTGSILASTILHGLPFGLGRAFGM
jgi:hypothetical protein